MGTTELDISIMSSSSGASGLRRRTRLIGSLVLAVVLSGCLAYLATAVVVRRHVLDASVYTGALAEADAYNRVYTEVLTDPELTETVADLLGHVEADPTLAVDVTATTANALRWALPPSRVQAGTDAFIEDTVAFLRGDADEFRPTVELSGVLDRVDEAAVTFARSLLTRAEVVEHGSADEYRVAVNDFVAELAAGQVPAAIPVLDSAAFDPDEVVDIILEATGTADDPERRAQVAASLAADDPVGAIADQAAEQVRPFVERQVRSLEEADRDGQIDVVAEITDRARTQADGAKVTLVGARDALGWFGPGPMAVVGLIALAAFGGIVALNRRRGRRLAALVAGSFASAALLLLLGARVVGGRLVEPLDAATGTGAGTWNLPIGIRAVLTDVADVLGGDLRRQIVGVAGSLALVALAAAFAGVALHLLRAVRSVAGTATTAVRSRATSRPTFAAGAACVALLVGAVVVTATSVDAGSKEPCNGHVELCDRPYDEVAYASTHNSMSSPGVVDVWPEQDGNLTAQLDAGVRALLIDTHYWRRIDNAADLVESADGTSVPISLPVARAVLDAAGSLAEGRPGTFLCHNECVFGGMPFVDALVEVRTFLEANPREVVTLIIQDAIEVEDTVEAFEEAGLDDLLYDHADRWPTLGELIDRDRRLVVFAEFEGGSPAWYADAWTAMQDTPFGFESPAAMSCEPNRGEGDPSLFLLNHWVSRLTPSRAEAAIVNQHDFLLERARRCEEERGLMPNFLAVDFSNIGDVVAVADELNGVG